MQQLSFTEFECAISSKVNRKEKFLTTMNKVLPWKAIIDLILPFYPQTPIVLGRRPYPLETMLRIYIIQHFYNLSDGAAESELTDSIAIRKFAKLGSLRNPTPDETTILHFRHLLECHELTSEIFKLINAHLVESGLQVGGGSTVDATIIQAPSSTKNSKKERDPEMKQTKKGNQYYFGMKVHIGADAETGLVHSIEVTSANVCDVTMTDKLIRSEDRFVIGDAGYRGSEKRTSHADVAFIIAMMRSKRKLIEGTFRDQFEKALSGIRSKVEHVFRIIKDQFNYRKVRYRGLAKNKHSMIVKIALANIYQARKYLIQRA